MHFECSLLHTNMAIVKNSTTEYNHPRTRQHAGVIWVKDIPSNPSCLQATAASRWPHPSEQTFFHSLFLQIWRIPLKVSVSLKSSLVQFTVYIYIYIYTDLFYISAKLTHAKRSLSSWLHKSYYRTRSMDMGKVSMQSEGCQG